MTFSNTRGVFSYVRTASGFDLALYWQWSHTHGFAVVHGALPDAIVKLLCARGIVMPSTYLGTTIDAAKAAAREFSLAVENGPDGWQFSQAAA